MSRIAIYIIFILVGVATIYIFQKQGLIQKTIIQKAPNITTAFLGNRTKTSGCISVNGFPDNACTPGDIDPSVTQNNIAQTICVKGYTKTVRPPVSYTDPLKLKLMQAYGDSDFPRNYELDHLISLELGGNPTSEANLWPEPYNIQFGAHEKDKVENYLHDQVCNGTLSLQEAQKEISTNWEEVYQRINH